MRPAVRHRQLRNISDRATWAQPKTTDGIGKSNAKTSSIGTAIGARPGGHHDKRGNEMITGTRPDERSETYTCPGCGQEHRWCDAPCLTPAEAENQERGLAIRITRLEALVAEMGTRLTDHECRHETTRRAKMWQERVEETKQAMRRE